ncbi:APC family permease [Levilactobacillus brevis]|uniref:APC family permease n=1 Tax=Levilactobacillus brevis TaxID=1580 RepID=UPI000467270A|nr:APC family permease [Levilactobacillus brevis]MBU7539193.1 APC family permease [Levilactobacillus brevis]MBU7558697.1 APC family permease [Levilactobacillus brevis]MBU7565344.1 APC family permease [Levilactobacillus brevis]MCE6010242.1 APC family permease [Levilactobacillus brevis]MCE6012649.1 APC family permease [Levilactobacillus brevis]
MKESGGLERRIGTFQAITINMSQMMGAGPFITIPLVLTTMGGPQAMFGWIAGAVLALLDGQIWSELGSSLPGEGGTYNYLKAAFHDRTGNLMPFLFIWSVLLATPLTLSSGAIGLANYMTYFFPALTGLQTKLIAVAVTLLAMVLLYRRVTSVAKISLILWLGMILTVILIVITGLLHFDPQLAFDFPQGAFAPNKFLLGLGAGMLLSIYDYLGYYTSAYMGDELRTPGKTLPRSITLSIIFVALIDLSMNIGIIGYVPWREAAHSANVGSLFMTRAWGPWGGAIITILIIWTCFASVYTGLLGASRIPYNAAKDGVFFKKFAHLHPKMKFPNYSLVVIGLIMVICCFFDLTTVINALMAVQIVVQFMMQIIALSVLRRKHPRLNRPYKEWLYPIPSIIAFLGWGFVFFSSGVSAISLAVIWTIIGILVFWGRTWYVNHVKPAMTTGGQDVDN